MRKWKHSAFAVVTALLLSGAQSNSAELVIGEIHPLSGSASFYGLPMSEAIQLAVEEINEAGGVKVGGDSYKLLLVSGDDQGNATVGVAALRKIIGGGAKYIIGPLPSGVAPALKPIFDANPNVTQIIDGTIAEGLLNGKNVFRNQTTPDGFSLPSLRIAGAKKYERVALITDRLQVGYISREGDFIAKLKDQGNKVVAKEYMKLGDTDFSAQLTNIIAAKPNAILIRAYPNESALMTKQARRLGFEGQIIWSALAPPETVMKNISNEEMQGVLDGFPSEASDLAATGHEPAIKMAKAFRKKFGKGPGELSGLSYDAVYILKAGIEKAGSVENEKVNKALFSLKLDELTNLANIYEPYPDGRLFDDSGQALLPGAAHIWADGRWAPFNLGSN